MLQLSEVLQRVVQSQVPLVSEGMRQGTELCHGIFRNKMMGDFVLRVFLDVIAFLKRLKPGFLEHFWGIA